MIFGKAIVRATCLKQAKDLFKGNQYSNLEEVDSNDFEIDVSETQLDEEYT
jgi:hypothetical protein